MALTSGRRAGETPRRRGTGGGAATPDGEGTASGTATTPHKGAPAPAAVTPTPTTNGGSGSPLRRRGRAGTEAAGGNVAAASQQQKAVTAGAGGLNVRLVLVVLAVVALVARLSVPALKELRAMVMFRHGRGMTEEQVRAVVLQTLDKRDKEQASKRGGGLLWGRGKGSGVVGKEEIRQAFRELMKEEGTAMVAATLPPPPAPVTVAAAPAAPAMDESALRREIQGEVARQLRAFGPAGQPPSEEDRVTAAARGIVP